MLYPVEIALNRATLGDEMGHMRTWLDRRQYHAMTFRLTKNSHTVNVEFRDKGEAKEFADAFGGRLLAAPPG